MKTTVLGLGGSMRTGSTALMALRVALSGAQEAGSRTRLMDLSIVHLPIFNGTTSLAAYSSNEREGIRALLDAVRQAQGVILASPTYHNSISGALKNALDILELLNEERPPGLEGRAVGLVAVQGGTSGTGNNCLTTMLLAARALQAWVVPTMVSVPNSREAFDMAGLPRDRSILDRLHSLGREVAHAGKLLDEHSSPQMESSKAPGTS